jgi:hypothetical protein
MNNIYLFICLNLRDITFLLLPQTVNVTERVELFSRYQKTYKAYQMGAKRYEITFLSAFVPSKNSI